MSLPPPIHCSILYLKMRNSLAEQLSDIRDNVTRTTGDSHTQEQEQKHRSDRNDRTVEVEFTEVQKEILAQAYKKLLLAQARDARASGVLMLSIGVNLAVLSLGCLTLILKSVTGR